MKNCYCCSGKTFENCCQRFIERIAKPATAEALMRSRYSSYVVANIEYILKTTHHSTRRYHNAEAIKDWAANSLWQKLEIKSTVKGNPADSKGTVEFKAYYLDSGFQPHVHHENSNFIKESGEWFFVDGKIITENNIIRYF
jgi:SEC-C motif domain protein